MNTPHWASMLVVMLVIAAVDYALGVTAEYLNAYEVLRRTVVPDLPLVAERFVWGQASLGRAALPIAWLAWLLEAAIIELLLRQALRLVSA